MDHIFVQIAAYRDADTLATILDCLERAQHPERVRIGLVWQYLRGRDEGLLPARHVPRGVRMLSVDAARSEGVCWARALTQTLYRGEPWLLSVDSHTRFETDWDTGLVEEHAACGHRRAVLAHYPPAFPAERTEEQPSVLLPGEPGAVVPRLRSMLLREVPVRPLRGLFVAGGFHFGPGDMVRHAPYDPLLWFDEEEFVHSLRLFCAGYRVYHPRRHFVRHRYVRGDDTHPRFTDDFSHWPRFQQRSRVHVRSILGMGASTHPEGGDGFATHLGMVGTPAQFLDLAGLDLGPGGSRARIPGAAALRALDPSLSFSLIE